MTTPVTPEQAREIASSLFFHDGHQANTLRSLADQVESLTKERDALKAELARPESTAVSMMRAENAELTAQLETLQYEVDAIPAIKAERDEYEKCADTMAAAHKVERDALKDAARLALDALEAAQWKNWRTDKAIAALKAVL